MKYIKKLIVILTILMVLIIGMIIIIKVKASREEQKEVEKVDTGLVYDNNNNGFQKVQDPGAFYAIINSLNNYFMILSYDGSFDVSNNPFGIENSEQQKEICLDILDKDYIEKNNIKNDFEKNVQLIKYKYNLVPISMRVRYDDNIICYIVNVYIENMENNNLDEKYYIVRLDNQNSTFSVEPILDKYTNIDDISVEKSKNSIEKNNYNTFNIETVSTEGLVKIYMQHFASMSITNPEIIYDNYLDVEYRDKRFGNIVEFKKYVQANKEAIQQIRIKKYSTENDGEQTKYVLIDMNENAYEFYEKSVMDYKVKLDTYTIPTEKFKETYAQAEDAKKVQMNIDKFFQMINRQDYTNAYKCLAEGYKNNYFKTEEEFIKYVKNNFFKYNKITFKSYEQKGNKLYVFKVKLEDITGENANEKEIKVIMQLNEDMNFVMSFGM